MQVREALLQSPACAAWGLVAQQREVGWLRSSWDWRRWYPADGVCGRWEPGSPASLRPWRPTGYLCLSLFHQEIEEIVISPIQSASYGKVPREELPGFPTSEWREHHVTGRELVQAGRGWNDSPMGFNFLICKRRIIIALLPTSCGHPINSQVWRGRWAPASLSEQSQLLGCVGSRAFYPFTMSTCKNKRFLKAFTTF